MSAKREISNDFAEKFKEAYGDFYQRYKDEIIIGIRDKYINLYYNCDSISKIEEKRYQPLEGKINDNRLTENVTKAGKQMILSPRDLEVQYKLIKKISNDSKSSPEAKAQSQLYTENNKNTDSKWFCIDVEYMQSHQKRRFDIIAISKEKSPRHKVAVIEVKYGDAALSGKAGVRKHIQDFYEYQKDGYFAPEEICSIIEGLHKVGVELPSSIQKITPKDIDEQVAFYIIVLDNNAKKSSGSTPKQKAGGQLFNKGFWDNRQATSLVKSEGSYFDLIQNDPDFDLTFLFSSATLPSLGIRDIIEDKSYDREVIKIKK